MYSVYVNNVKVKSYKYKIQATVYCFLKGYIYSGGCDFDNDWYYFYDDRVKVVREDE